MGKGGRQFSGMRVTGPISRTVRKSIRTSIFFSNVVEGLPAAATRKCLHGHIGNPLFTYSRKGMISIHPLLHVSVVTVLECGSYKCSSCGAFRVGSRSNTIQYNTTRYNTIQYHTTRYYTIQYNTIRYNTIQSKVR